MTNPMQDLPPELLAALAAADETDPDVAALGPTADVPIPQPEGGGLPPVLPADPEQPAALPTDAPLPPPTLGPPEDPATAAVPGAVEADGANIFDDRPAPEQVNYRWGDTCLTCEKFIAPESCSLVNGHIRADGVCDLFVQQAGLPFDTVLGDVD